MGVFEVKDISANIAPAKTIAPDLKRIIFLGDDGTTDKAINTTIENYNSHFKDVDIIHISNSNLDQLLTQLNASGEGVVILTTIGGLHDQQKRLIDLDTVIRSIVATDRMILTMEDTYLLPGIIGGYLTTGKLQGKSAAQIASQFIHTGKINHNSPDKTSELKLNWQELQRFNIQLPEKLLKQAEILNQPPEKNNAPAYNKALIIFIIILLLGLLISLINTRRKNLLLKEQKTDKLTGLPNRIKLLDDIQHATCPSLAIIDIRNFKAINNLYGLTVGDKLLISFGNKARELINNKYNLYRTTGNQFAILNSNCTSSINFELTISQFLNNIQNHIFKSEQLEIYLTVTAGISRNEREFLVPMAEQALQEAKDENKDSVLCDIHEDISSIHQKNLIWARKLNSALNDNRIVPYFQVITDNTTGRQNKYEALVRLIDEDGKIISPFFFLDAAKSTWQYASLTEVIIEKTCKLLQDKDIQISRYPDIQISRYPLTLALMIFVMKKPLPI